MYNINQGTSIAKLSSRINFNYCRKVDNKDKGARLRIQVMI